MSRWLRRRAARRKAAAQLVWAQERAADLAFARSSWRAYVRKESQEVR